MTYIFHFKNWIGKRPTTHPTLDRTYKIQLQHHGITTQLEQL